MLRVDSFNYGALHTIRLSAGLYHTKKAEYLASSSGMRDMMKGQKPDCLVRELQVQRHSTSAETKIKINHAGVPGTSRENPTNGVILSTFNCQHFSRRN